jgi:hypothetical protein
MNICSFTNFARDERLSASHETFQPKNFSTRFSPSLQNTIGRFLETLDNHFHNVLLNVIL